MMGEVIETTDITDSTEEKSTKLAKMSEMYWGDYLKYKNYNKDINKMCELCIADQNEKFGKQTIKCTGLRDVGNVLSDTGVTHEELEKVMSPQELEDLASLYNPYDFMEYNCDLKRKGSDKRLFIGRWYQKQLLGCSAISKVVRMGRRTGKTYSLATLIIHNCLTNAGHRALLVSPFEVQTKEVVDAIKELCASFRDNPIETATSSPIEVIKFKNGAILKGFTAGVSGNSVRGQPGDSIYLDEYDDINQMALTSIVGILMDNADVSIWRSGTPKGEGNLYKASQDPGTKEFHFPSFVNPNYSDTMDQMIRSEMDEIGYVQEAMGEYGARADGVFQTIFVARATEHSPDIYLTPARVMERRKDYIVIAGVDWNHDKVGTRIVVVASSKYDDKFHIIDQYRVALEGWTQEEAMETIKTVNRKYNLDHLYVDAGFGSTQISSLRAFGERQAMLVRTGQVKPNDPDINLMELQAVDYGGNEVLQDPLTGEIFKQGRKQFCVHNTVLCLEKQQLVLNPKTNKDIIDQMKNYIERSRTKGKVVYGYVSKKIGDHDLDALMIALYGFKKNYSYLFAGNAGGVMMNIVASRDPENPDPNEIPLEHKDTGPSIAIFKHSLNKSSNRVSRMNITSNRSRGFR